MLKSLKHASLFTKTENLQQKSFYNFGLKTSTLIPFLLFSKVEELQLTDRPGANVIKLFMAVIYEFL